MTNEEIKQMNRNTAELTRLTKVMQKAMDERPPQVILVGGNPLGYSIPFHPETKSGKVLRGIVKEVGLNAQYFDIWKNPKQEYESLLDSDILRRLIRYQKAGWTIVALGSKVQAAMKQYTRWSEDRWDYENTLSYVSLPHPAARRPEDIVKLREGLLEIRDARPK